MKHLTQEQIEQSTKEDLQNYTKQIQEEIDKIIDDRDSKEAFRELVGLKIKCDLQINLLEFREMVHKGRKWKRIRNNRTIEEEESKYPSIQDKEFTSPRKTIRETIKWIYQITKKNRHMLFKELEKDFCWVKLEIKDRSEYRKSKK